jgi:hypothetical protein
MEFEILAMWWESISKSKIRLWKTTSGPCQTALPLKNHYLNGYLFSGCDEHPEFSSTPFERQVPHQLYLRSLFGPYSLHSTHR